MKTYRLSYEDVVPDLIQQIKNEIPVIQGGRKLPVEAYVDMVIDTYNKYRRLAQKRLQTKKTKEKSGKAVPQISDIKKQQAELDAILNKK